MTGTVTPQWTIGQLTLPAPRQRPKELIRPNAAAAEKGTPTSLPATLPSAVPASQPIIAAPIKAGNLKGEVTPDGTFVAAPARFKAAEFLRRQAMSPVLRGYGFSRLRPGNWTLSKARRKAAAHLDRRGNEVCRP